jgi:hypothetical protein
MNSVNVLRVANFSTAFGEQLLKLSEDVLQLCVYVWELRLEDFQPKSFGRSTFAISFF